MKNETSSDAADYLRPQEQEQNSHPMVVGIGASAGGVQALSVFFSNVSENVGMAYVVILHLSPDYDSKLVEVLQLSTKMPVSRVLSKTLVEANHVYVISPAAHLVMHDNYIEVQPNIEIEDRRAPVDIFFRTLAESHGARAVGVVLSGTGANGSMGLKRIKEKGGAVFVQNPKEAEFNEMPRNAIATDLVDEVLPVAAIPQKIIDYKNGLASILIPLAAEERPKDQQQALKEILAHLRLRTGHDFSNYKLPTLLRRIERRISICNLPDLPSYAAFIAAHPEDTTALLKDLLISVTNFFRDKKAFETLEQDVLPRIITGKENPGQVRVWVAGCATGEEAYSLAMLFAEKTGGMESPPKIQIFATDIDEMAIARAREGLYSINDAADVSPERLEKFFVQEGDAYRIAKEIRETILFAHHNFLKDPPFSNLDLISCRNVMIYLNQVAQERVMETFHFALKPGTFLFLGSSESVDSGSDLFSPFHREAHIFQSSHLATRNYPVPESVPRLTYPAPTQNASQEQDMRGSGRLTFADLHQRLLEQFAPPSLVVNEDYEIVHLSEQVGRYLQISGGEPSQNLLKLVRDELRLELRSALYQAVHRQLAVEVKNLKINLENRTEIITIHVRPVLRKDDIASGFILVIFEEATGQPEAENIITSDKPVARHLEEQLIRVKAQLRTSIEQHELKEEELKASNEELQAMNEEMRSATEELETSKEELQSINEELRTVNQELKVKIEETSTASNNLQNLINSADIGTIFLDRSFRLALFTPSVCKIFNLIPSDYGRPLTDITHRLNYKHLLKDAGLVLEQLTLVEREVQTTNGLVFVMRMLPYRTNEDRIGGIVITFFDITKRKQTEGALGESMADFKAAFESSSIPKMLTDTSGAILRVNEAVCLMLGYQTDELLQKTVWDIISPENMDRVAESGEELLENDEGEKQMERRFIRKDGGLVWGEITINLIRDVEGKPQRAVAVLQDINERKKAEQDLQESERRFRTLTDAVHEIIWTNNKNGKADYFNRRWYDYSGLTFKESETLGWQAIIHPDDAQASISQWEQALKAGSIFDTEYRLRRSDGSYRWHLGRNVPLHDGQGNVLAWFGSATDIQDLKVAQQNARESAERLKVTVESATDFAIITTNAEGIIEEWSTGAENAFGYTQQEAIGQPASILFTPEDREAGAVEQEMGTAREKGRAADERWHLRKDGSRFFLSGVMAPIRSNILTGYVKVARDMTRHKKAEETLKISEERYRIALQSAELAAWDWDIVTNNIVWNEHHFTILGLTPSNTIMDPTFFLQFVHRNDFERIKNALYKAKDESGSFNEEFRIIRADNKAVRWMSGFGRVVTVEKGLATRMVGVMQDFTKRKVLEQQQEDFIGIASHELRTPVTSIKAYSELMREVFEESGDNDSALMMEKLDTQVDRLTGLIRDLLDSTKIQERQLPLTIASFNLGGLLKETTEELANLSPKHKLVTGSCEFEIEADRERIKQVLTNLISNAVKYSPKGGDIEIGCRQENDGVLVSIKDNGIGIPEELQDKVFDRFFRIRQGDKGSFPGIGLGLYIAGGIISHHGGSIWVKSTPGVGSVFYFKLPHKAAPAE